MTWQPTQLEKQRLDKLERLKEAGVEPYPLRIERTHTTAEAVSAFEAAEEDAAARLHAALLHGFVQGQGDAGCRGVAESVDVVEDLLFGGFLGRCFFPGLRLGGPAERLEIVHFDRPLLGPRSRGQRLDPQHLLKLLQLEILHPIVIA